MATEYKFNESQFIYLCNDEGKLNKLRPSRAIYIVNNKPKDVIFGDFIVTKSDENGNWMSLTDEECSFIIKDMNRPIRNPWPYIIHMTNIDKSMG